MTWTETGGPRVEPPARQGFGSILIRRSLAKVIASEVSHEFRPEGVLRCNHPSAGGIVRLNFGRSCPALSRRASLSPGLVFSR